MTRSGLVSPSIALTFYTNRLLRIGHPAVPTFEMWSCVVEQRWFVTALLGIDLKKSFWLQRHARTASWEAAPQIPNVGLGASPQTATVMGSSASRFNPTQILPFGFGPPR